MPLLFIVPTTLLRAARVFVRDRLIALGPTPAEPRQLSQGETVNSRFNSAGTKGTGEKLFSDDTGSECESFDASYMIGDEEQLMDAGIAGDTQSLLAPLLPGQSAVGLPPRGEVHVHDDIRQWSDDFEPTPSKARGGISAAVGGDTRGRGGSASVGSMLSVGPSQQSKDASLVGNPVDTLVSIGALPVQERLLSNWKMMKLYYWLFDGIVDVLIYFQVLKIIPLRQVEHLRAHN